jgi:predicted ABC-type ATPase
MDWRSLLDARPIVVALAGSNGAGKSTFFHAHLAGAGLRFINADDLAAEMRLGPYEAAGLAASLRASLLERRASYSRPFFPILSARRSPNWRRPAGGAFMSS